MTEFISISMGALAMITYWLYSRRKRRTEIRNKIIASWGKKKQREHNWNRIKAYHHLSKAEADQSIIDTKTWEDLNLKRFFGLIDRTESYIGQQVLYDLLHCPLYGTEKLEERKRLIELFASHKDFRTDLQVELRKLTDYSIWRIPTLFLDELPDIPKSYRLFVLVPVTVIGCIGLGFLYPIFWLALGIIPVINLVIQYFVRSNIAKYSSALSGLRPFLSVAEKIGEIDQQRGNPLGTVGKELRKQASTLRKLKKRVSSYLHEGNPDQLGTLFWDYLNLLFLLKINMFTLSIQLLHRHKQTLKKLHYTVGLLDSMISAASFHKSLPTTCIPDFSAHKDEVKYSSVYHPLLEEPVANDIQIGVKGILVTGSNMSGKTTFLKTLGINQLLAQTFNFCCARRATLPFCKVISSMRRDDNLTEGKSFYLGEVERVKQLINTRNDMGNTLYLLDEIFRGTNTIERIAASKEVLAWLNKTNGFVLASTHDLELVTLLDKQYEFYHFAEEVQNGGLHFDYRIKPGHSSTKNAIKLLGLNSYPEEIVEQAMDLSEFLEQEGVINYRVSSNP